MFAKAVFGNTWSTLMKEINIQEELKEDMMEGHLKLKNDGTNKVQCIDKEI